MPYWRLYYHLIWPTKGRAPVITAANRGEVYAAISRKVIALGGAVFGIGGIEDHVHLAVSIPPTLSIASFVGQVKGASAHYVNHGVSGSPNIEWQRGYGAVSLRRGDLDQILSYIEGQAEHHASGKIFSSLERFDEDEGATHSSAVAETPGEYTW